MQPSMDTICKNCIFAVYGNQHDNSEQTGCFFNRIEMYKKQGANVVEAEDEEKKFFVIQERLCLACRDVSWKEALPNHSIKELAEIVRRKMTGATEVFVFTDNLEKLDLTVKSLMAQTLKPSCIVAMTTADGKVRPSDIIKVVGQAENWRISTGRANHHNETLDFAVHKCVAPHFAVFNNGYHVPANFLQRIDSSLHDNLNRFILLLPDDEGNGFWTHTKFYQKLQGNNGGATYIEKIIALAKDQNSEFLIQNSEDVWKK